MPEELMLPGIDDPAPATPDTPAAPPSGDDTASQSASDDTGAPAPPGDAPEPEETPQAKKSRGGFQNRINELVAERRNSQQESAQLRELLAMVIRGGMSPQQAKEQAGPNTEQAPKEADFASYRDFERAEAKYIARQEIRDELENRAKVDRQNYQQYQEKQSEQQRAAAEDQLHEVAGTQMHEARARYPDYMDVIESCPIPIPTNVEAAMAYTRNAGDVAYYLAKNPRVIQQLSQMPDLAMSHHVTRIANAMRSAATSVSNAPPPGQPAGNRGTPTNDYPKDATPQQHLEWEARNKKRQEKRA
jgi:hypothetical protein